MSFPKSAISEANAHIARLAEDNVRKAERISELEGMLAEAREVWLAGYDCCREAQGGFVLVLSTCVCQ